MKKILCFAVVALATGFGMHARAAVTNASFNSWSFETLPVSTVIPSTEDPTVLPGPYGSWSADTNGENVAYITNETWGATPGFGFPIAGGTADHTNALYFNGSVTNHFSSSLLNGLRFTTEFLLKPGQLENLSLLDSVDPNARLAFYFNTASNFVLLHGVMGAWTTSDVATVAYETNAWLRISIDQDYAMENENNGSFMFSVSINGTGVTHAVNGSTRLNDSGGYEPGGADPKWFEMKSKGTAGNFGMNGLVGMGAGMVDDVVVSAPAGAAVTNVNATSAGNGTITPSGTVSITDGTPQAFTLTSVSGYYVSGLTLDATQINTNLSESVTSVVWSVDYAQVAAYGTNLTALFSEKSKTNVTASSINVAYGSVTPSGTVAITNGVARTFALSSEAGCYVSGLKLNTTTIYTNLVQTVTAQNYDVAYAQVVAYGDNVVALFEPKSGTTAEWLSNVFVIGPGGDYATFAIAATNDWDQDGFNNVQESIAGTAPKDSNDFLRVSAIVVNAGEVAVSFKGSALGTTNHYELKGADVVNGSYTNVSTRAKVSGDLSVTNATGEQKKFYKVVVPYSGE